MHGNQFKWINLKVRLKPQVGYQKEDLRINGNRVGILDVNGRGIFSFLFIFFLVKEDFECNEIFTPDMNMPRVFDQTVSLCNNFNSNSFHLILEHLQKE